MQAAMFAAAPRMSTTQRSNSHFAPLKETQTAELEAKRETGWDYFFLGGHLTLHTGGFCSVFSFYNKVHVV